MSIIKIDPNKLPKPTPPQAVIVASVGIIIADGQVSSLEFPANLQSVTYESGWLMVVFNETQENTGYQIFALTDKPAQMEQFKNEGYFELVFSDGNGNPVEPLRVDIQILKVR